MCDPGRALETSSNHEPAADSSSNPFNKDRLVTSGSNLWYELSDAEYSMMVKCQCFADVSDLGVVCRPSG